MLGQRSPPAAPAAPRPAPPHPGHQPQLASWSRGPETACKCLPAMGLARPPLHGVGGKGLQPAPNNLQGLGRRAGAPGHGGGRLRPEFGAAARRRAPQLQRPGPGVPSATIVDGALQGPWGFPPWGQAAPAVRQCCSAAAGVGMMCGCSHVHAVPISLWQCCSSMQRAVGSLIHCWQPGMLPSRRLRQAVLPSRQSKAGTAAAGEPTAAPSTGMSSTNMHMPAASRTCALRACPAAFSNPYISPFLGIIPRGPRLAARRGCPRRSAPSSWAGARAGRSPSAAAAPPGGP